MNRRTTKSAARFRSKRGMASALIIMLLVLLIFFGVLSLVASAADLRLAKKRAEWNQAYYLADAQAVDFLAALDGYCSGLDADQAEALLTEWLDGQQNITDWSLESMTEEQGALSLAALVLSQTGQGQGIAVRLTIRTGRSMEGRSITIEEWRQWQPPFEYGDSKGGLWEG
ncbi:MAG: hypothetical protein GX218_08210 [Clostridiaceae bacterium]|nr:hypothetical protein [Clostridiaceae bacterium]